MSARLQVIFWLAALALFLLAVWLLSDILLPFVAGLVLAYFLNPVAVALQRLGLPRLAGSLIILGSSIVALLLLVVYLLPVLGGQIARLAERLPDDIAILAGHIDRILPDWLRDLLAQAEAAASGADLAARAASWMAAMLGSLWTGGLALVNLISLIVVTPVVAFYMLKDWDRLVTTVDGWLPRDHADTIRDIARQIDQAIAGFIRGQGTVCLLLATFYAVGLVAVGLRFGLLIGLAAGLLSFIPMVGALVGGLASVGMAVVQFWPDWGRVAVVAGIFVVGQLVEGNFLSPKLVGDRIGLHPVWLIFALFAFAYLFGFVGVLLAVPMAAAVGVLCRFALDRYLESRVYLGGVHLEPPTGGKRGSDQP